MTTVTKTSAKAYFTTGAYPTQSQFGDFIDSCIFSAESSAQSIATLNITTKLSAVAANITTVSAVVGGMLTGSLPNPTLSLSQITNSLSGDVNLNNTGSYFDGPVIAQGTTGTWFASGKVTLTDSTGSGIFIVKLWDGTTIIDSTAIVLSSTQLYAVLALSGYLANPTGNIRISVRDSSSTSGKILFNQSGNSKDSTISAFRIA